MTRFAGALLGIVAAIFAETASLFVAGAGHGWTQPFKFGPITLVMLPIAGILYGTGFLPSRRRLYCWSVLAVAAITDAGLVVGTIREGFHYVLDSWRAVGPFLALWLILWLAWQVVPVGLLIVRHGVDPR